MREKGREGYERVVLEREGQWSGRVRSCDGSVAERRGGVVRVGKARVEYGRAASGR